MPAELEVLKAAYDAAREADRLHRTPATMQAVVDAWTALEDATPLRKAASHASRAGKRQAAARRVRK